MSYTAATLAGVSSLWRRSVNEPVQRSERCTERHSRCDQPFVGPASTDSIFAEPQTDSSRAWLRFRGINSLEWSQITARRILPGRRKAGILLSLVLCQNRVRTPGTGDVLAVHTRCRLTIPLRGGILTVDVTSLAIVVDRPILLHCGLFPFHGSQQAFVHRWMLSLRSAFPKPTYILR